MPTIGRALMASLFCLTACLLNPAWGLQFEDVTEVSGLSHHGTTWGASWRDVNADGLNDLTLSLHGNALWARPKAFSPATNVNVYFNLGDGRFENRSKSVFGRIRPGDWHGSAWADYDGDGDEDVFFMRGGASGTAKSKALSELERARMSNQLFRQNDDGRFDEVADSAGLSLPRQRGRRGSWFDIDQDGRLDLVLAQASPDGPGSVVYLNRGTEFAACSRALPGLKPTNNFAAGLLFRGFADDARYLMLGGATPLLYRQLEPPQKCLFEPLPVVEAGTRRAGFSDFVLADLDADLGLDFYGATQCVRPQFAHSEKHMVLRLPGSQTAQIRFRADKGSLIVRPKIGPRAWFGTPEGDRVFVGDGLVEIRNESIKFDKSSKHFHVSKTPPGQSHGVFLYYNPHDDLWTLLVKKRRSQGVRIEMLGLSRFELVQPPVMQAGCKADKGNRFFVQGKKSWREPWGDPDKATEVGNTSSVTAGDFDNDGDLDLVIGASDQSGDVGLVLLENEAQGFAAREVFPRLSVNELAFDSVSSGDANNDGFLDILTTMGNGKIHPAGSTVRLFLNNGNNNSWIRFRLHPSSGGEDAPGTRVFLTTSDRTQMRYSTGGIRPKAQDESILHFGLGKTRKIERLLVQWPQGQLELFEPVEVEQTVDLIQGAGRTVDTPQLMISGRRQPAGRPVRLLMLVPPRLAKSRSIEWRVDGSTLGDAGPMLLHHFAKGIHQVVARIDSASGVFETAPLMLEVE